MLPARHAMGVLTILFKAASICEWTGKEIQDQSDRQSVTMSGCVLPPHHIAG